MSKLKFKGLKRAIVKEEFVALTGDLEKAIVLNQFIYWSERIGDFDNFIQEEQERNEKEGIDPINLELQNGWIYKDMDELKEEVMFTSSVSTMGRKLKELVEEGWIDRRNNPKYKWDKRYQYRVNLLKVIKDLFEIGYTLQDYKIDMMEVLKNSNMHSDTSINQNDDSINQNDASNIHSDRALSEITTETTLEIINHSIISEKEKNKIDDGWNELINNLNLSYLEEKDQAPIVQAIKTLYNSQKGIVSNGIQVEPSEIIENLKQLQYKHIEQALKDYQQVSIRSYITNPTSYLGSCIYNAMFKPEIKKITYSNNAKQTNTKFHNFEQRTSRYTREQLEKMVLKKK